MPIRQIYLGPPLDRENKYAEDEDEDEDEEGNEGAVSKSQLLPLYLSCLKMLK